MGRLWCCRKMDALGETPSSGTSIRHESKVGAVRASRCDRLPQRSWRGIGLSEVDHLPLLAEPLGDDEDFFQHRWDLWGGDGEVIDEQDLLALGLCPCQGIRHFRARLREAVAPAQRGDLLQLLPQALAR